MQAQSIAKQADAIMQSLYAANEPGAALLIERGGKIITEKGYGLANMKTKGPVTASTDFRMASISKQVTAMSILLLAGRKKLSIGDLISKYLSPLPAALKTITIRQLLTHTSGIWDYEDLVPGTQKTQVPDEDVLRLVRQKDSTYFKPGTEFKYSNSGYCLLALIVQKASGILYASFVRENIFIPLKMNHSRIYFPEEKIPERAFGYHWNKNAWHFADQSLTSATQGDGGVYTSLKDYLKWNKALNNDQLLPKNLMDSIFTGHVKVKNGVDYGYGWFIGKEKKGSICTFHSGESTGFHNIVYRNPQDKLLIAIFSNRDDDTIANAFDKIANLLQVNITFQDGNPRQVNPSLFHWLSSVYGD